MIAPGTAAGPMDIFAPGAAAVAVLLSLRLTGLVLIASVFCVVRGEREVPAPL